MTIEMTSIERVQARFTVGSGFEELLSEEIVDEIIETMRGKDV